MLGSILWIARESSRLLSVKGASISICEYAVKCLIQQLNTYHFHIEYGF